MEEVAQVVVVDRLAGEPRIRRRDGHRARAAGEEGDVHRLLGAEDLGGVSAQPDVGGKEEKRRRFDEDEAAQPGAIGLSPEDERPAEHGGDDHHRDQRGCAKRRHMQ